MRSNCRFNAVWIYDRSVRASPQVPRYMNGMFWQLTCLSKAVGGRISRVAGRCGPDLLYDCDIQKVIATIKYRTGFSQRRDHFSSD